MAAAMTSTISKESRAKGRSRHARHCAARAAERYGAAITVIDVAMMGNAMSRKSKKPDIERDGLAVFWGFKKSRRKRGRYTTAYWRIFWRGYAFDVIAGLRKNGWYALTFLPPGVLTERWWLADYVLDKPPLKQKAIK